MNSIKKQHRHLLWMLMNFPITRYLLSNIQGRYDGNEKATRHIELSTIFIAGKMLCSEDQAKSKYWDKMMKIHDATQKLTAHMDTEIGFPLEEYPENLDELEIKFFNKFLKYAEEEWKRIS